MFNAAAMKSKSMAAFKSHQLNDQAAAAEHDMLRKKQEERKKDVMKKKLEIQRQKQTLLQKQINQQKVSHTSGSFSEFRNWVPKIG